MTNDRSNAAAQIAMTAAWVTPGTVKAQLLAGGFVFDRATHLNLADIDAGDRIADPATITGRVSVAGVATCDALTFSSGMTTGDPFVGFVLYIDSGSEATSTILTYVDEGYDDTPLADTTNGADIFYNFVSAEFGGVWDF